MHKPLGPSFRNISQQEFKTLTSETDISDRQGTIKQIFDLCEEQTEILTSAKDSDGPKYQVMTKMTILIEDDHRYMLDKLSKVIMRNRKSSNELERITSNSVCRAILTVFMKGCAQFMEHADLDDIHSDLELAERMNRYEKYSLYEIMELCSEFI